MNAPPDTAVLHGDRRQALAAVVVMTACLAALTWPAAPALAGGSRDWSGVQLAWQNDPRAVSDASLPVEPMPERRPSRREQRRNLRRGLPEPTATGGRERAATPRPAPLGRSGEPGVQSAPPRSTPGMVGLAADPVIGLADPIGNDRVLVHRDQPYGSDGHQQQRFDLHLPDGCSGSGLPLVVWIHGPDWKSGSKADCPIIWLAGEGYAVASIGYRTSDVAVFPAQLDDCRAAIDSLVADASTWGIDPTRVCVAGTAAGGHLAALVAFAPVGAGRIRETAAEPHAGGATAPAAVVIVGAPVSLTTLGPAHDRAGSPASRLVGGPVPEFREAAQRASPLAHVSADDPPTLIVHAIADAAVPAEQAALLEKTLTSAGVDTTLLVLGDPAAQASLAAGSPAAIALVEFLDRVIGPGIKGPRK